MTSAIPLILGSLLGVMVAILCVVLFLFYKKRKEIIDFKPQIEKMTRSLKKMGRNMTSNSEKSVNNPRKFSPATAKQIPVHHDTHFWVPEVYNSIVQPSPAPVRKASRLQSTLDREIYSKALDTSYLQATDNREVKRKNTPVFSPAQEHQRRLMSEPLNRGMLNFSLQYKQDVAILYIVVLKAEELVMRRNGEACNPFVYIQVTPTYKRHMHSEVHQKTQNPVFNQVFEFEVPPYEISEQTVTFTVLDFNQEFNHGTVGILRFKLDSLEHDAFFAGKEFTLWNRLEKDGVDDDKTSNKYLEYPKEMDLNKEEMLLLLSVKYIKHNEKLDVCVKQARNLPLHDKKGKIDHPYVSVSLKHAGRLVKKLKTNVVKHSANPIFNKNILFEIDGHPLDKMTLTVKLKNSELGRDRAFAILEIGKDAAGSGAQQWTDMISAGESHDVESIERWHCLIPIDPVED